MARNSRPRHNMNHDVGVVVGVGRCKTVVQIAAGAPKRWQAAQYLQPAAHTVCCYGDVGERG
eukprot:7739453-Alexandrium_andersonii.AAC.1